MIDYDYLNKVADDVIDVLEKNGVYISCIDNVFAMVNQKVLETPVKKIDE